LKYLSTSDKIVVTNIGGVAVMPMDSITFNGDREDLLSFFAKYVGENSAAGLLSCLEENSEYLSTEENFDATILGSGDTAVTPGVYTMGLVIPKTNYYVNLKVTTLLFLCLVGDFVLTAACPELSPFITQIPAGLAAVLGLLEITPNKRKLSDEQRSILKRIGKSKHKCLQLSQIYWEDNRPHKRQIEKALKELVSWGVVTKKSDGYRVVL